MFQRSPLAAAGAVLGFAAISSAVPLYGQCGGINYTGSTTCDNGSVCTYLNDWYYQCLPPSSTSSRTSSSSSVRTTPSPARTISSSTRTTSTTSIRTTSTSSRTTVSPNRTTSVSTPTGSCGYFGNPYQEGYSAYLSPFYVEEVNTAIAGMTSSALKAKASAVAKIPNFTWFDIAAKVPTLADYLADAQSQQTASDKKIVQIVIYDLPNRDCHAKASNGEFTIANNGINNYKAYINGIADAISQYPDVRVVAVVEPDSLANLVTNLNDPNCANARDAYMQCTTYALQTLRHCNIWLYLDAGHAGWLGWPANLGPAAQMFAQVYNSALPNRVRGLATNVANYNALSAATPDPVTVNNPNTDELKYINALAPQLQSQGFPAYFIVDQGRSGQQGIRDDWGNWCNIAGAGFGMRPTTNTGSSYIDAIVWVKPGGECDGTSDPSAPRYDSTCGLPDAKKPAPQAGQWFEAYFEDLLNFANPPLP